jgi:hypothetical protein
MPRSNDVLIGLLYRGQRNQNPASERADQVLGPLINEFALRGIEVVHVVFEEDASEVVLEEILALDGVMVWVNPIQDGANRASLDPLLQTAANQGVWVSANPDVIFKLGTKQVLYATRHLGWGSDVELYDSGEDFEQRFAERLQKHRRLVVKQARGNDGQGVWRVDLKEQVDEVVDETKVRVWDASTKTSDSVFSWSEAVIDQEFQARLADGMIRCYLTQDEVVGFCHQWPQGLIDDARLTSRTTAPRATMVGPEAAQYQQLGRLVTNEWLPQALSILDLRRDELPAIWDADFLIGSRDERGDDTYVLCEINLSAVWPFPPMAARRIVETAIRSAIDARNSR